MTDLMTDDAQLPAPPPPRGRRRGMFWLILGLGMIVVLGSVGLTIAGGSDASEGAADPAPSASASRTPEPLAAPRDARGIASAFEIVVTWKPPEGRSPDTYAVYRDGTIIARLTSAPLRVVDTGLVPMTTYRYTIVGDDANGPAGPPAVVRVTTGKGAPAFARLTGTFDVAAETTSTYGYSDSVDDWTAGLRFVPDCRLGPCDVELRDIHGLHAPVALHREGALYTGSGSGRIGVTCSDTEVTSSFRYEIRVVGAKAIDGAWRATRITGTFSQSEPSQLGCRASGITASLDGHLVG